MINFIDSLLNRITMYRLVLYFLILLVAVAAIFGAVGILPYGPLAIAFSTFVLLLVCWGTNQLFAWAVKAQPNVESVYITSLILALIITPIMPWDVSGIFFLIWAGVFAMASKYILALYKKHLFNPAAFAVALTALLLNQYASWWVGGNLPLLTFVLVGGLLITRKMQRFDLVLAFIIAAVLSMVVTGDAGDPLTMIQKALVHTPILFFAFIMITEPMTTPPTRALRIAYGAFVGALFAPAIHIGSFYSTPELALVVGNIFSYAVSPKTKHMLWLKEKTEVGPDMYHFVFTPDKMLRFSPGQYMEWTLAHPKSDSRGNRRYFTLASSPTEKEVHLGVRFNEPSSSFKKMMLDLEPRSAVIAGQLAGDFTMPKDKNKKLVFIAGGIGITPFRSMIKYLSDRAEKRDVVLLYSNRTTEKIPYRDIFDEAGRTIGLKTIYAVTGPSAALPEHNGHRGRIDAALIKKEAPDYSERMFYISGTHAMVAGFKKTLHDLGIPRAHIKTDFFPGFG